MESNWNEQLKRLRYVPNPVYDRLAEVAFEYIAEQTVVDLGNQNIVRRDLATLFAQIDLAMTPDDEEADADEIVDLANLPFGGPQLTDSQLLTAAKASPMLTLGGGK